MPAKDFLKFAARQIGPVRRLHDRYLAYVNQAPPPAGGIHLIDAFHSFGLPGVGTQPNGRQVVFLAASDLRIDPRIEREARALVGGGYTVAVICPNPNGDGTNGPDLDWGEGVTFDWLELTELSFLGRAPGYLAQGLYEAAIRYCPFAFHAHDLWTCYAGLAAARTTGAHLVADFHEWTSENVYWDAEEQKMLPFKLPEKLELAALEAVCLRECSAVITVCHSHADFMAEELGNGRRPTVLRNVPPLTLEPTVEYEPLKKQIDVAEDAFVVLWQGGTGPTRLLEPIIQALEHAPDVTFVIRGPSLELYGEEYKALAKSVGAEDRLILLPPVPSRDVVAAARGGDAGVWSLPDHCRNFRLALPNKIFEYLAAGLPVLVADYPEARKVAVDMKAGLTFDPYDPKAIAAAMMKLANDKALHKKLSKHVPQALKNLDADNEWAKLVTLYEGLETRPKKG